MVTANDILMTFTGKDQLTPVAKQVVAELQALEQQTGKTNAELSRLGLSTVSNTQTLQTHVQTLTQTSQAHQKLGDAAKKAGADAEAGFAQFGRGLASTVFNFGLLAGATVEAGHIVGEAILGSIEKAQELKDEIGSISALTPEMNVAPLFNQITALEVETGILSQKLTAVFSLAAQAGGTGGNEGATLDLTKQLSQGAQGNRQDPTGWAQSALAAMNAYGLKTQDVAHIQDLMTEALQRGAGQGQAFIQNLDRLTATSSQSHLSLEALTAAFETVAAHGGDAQKNVMGLNSIIAAFETDKAKAKLEALGVATTTFAADGTQQVRDLSAVWTDLATKMQGLSPATQQSLLTQIIPDKRSVSEFQVLLNNMDQYNSLLKDTETQAGATSKVVDEFGNSEEGAKAKLAGGKQALEEQIGQLIDLEGWFVKTKQAADAYYATHPLGSPTTAPEKVGGSALINPTAIGNIFTAIYGGDNGVQGTGGFTPKEQYAEQAQVREQAEKTSAAIKAEVLAYQALHEPVTQASRDAQVFADWNGKVFASSSTLTPTLAGLSSAVNQLYQESQRLTGAGAFGGFDSAQEQKIANIAEQLTIADGRLKAFNDTPASQSGLLGQIESGALTNKVKELQQALREASSQTPEGIQAQNTFSEFMQQNAATQSMAAAQQHLTDVTDSYNASIKRLTDQQHALQIQLRDDSSPALASARRDLDAATKNLDDTTKKYTADLAALNEQKYQAQQAEAQALDQPQRDLTSAQGDLKSQQAAQNKLLSDLNDQLYDATQKVTQAQAQEAAALAPLKTALDNAATATRNLEASQQAGDAEFQRSERAIQANIDAIQELAYQTLGPLHKEIERYQEELYKLNLAEQQELRPIQDAIYAQTAALRGAQEAAAAVADKYARELNPLQAQYNALQREAQQAQNADTLHKEAVSVDNLAARLAAAKKGSAEYLQLQQQLATAQTTQGRDTATFGLQDKIAAISAERDAALQAAQAEVERQQKVLDQLNQQQEAITHKYDLEKRGIQDTLDAKQHEYDLDQQSYSDAEAYYQHQLTLMQQDQAAYDLSMQDKIKQAKEVETNAQNAYDLEKARQDALVLSAQQAVATLQQTIGWYQQQFKGQNDNLQTAVNNAQLAVDQIRLYYEGPDGIITLLDKKISTEQHDATIFEQAAKDQVTSAQKHYKEVRDELQKTIDKLGDQITGVQNTATETEKAANRAITAEKAKQTALLNTLAIINAIETLIKAGGTYDPAKLADYYKQAGIKDPNTIPATPVGSNPPPPSQLPPDQRKDTPPGQVGHHSVIFQGDRVMVPVGAHTAGASQGHTASAVSPTININVNATGNLQDRKYWDSVAGVAFDAMQSHFGSTQGYRIVMEPLN